VLGAGLLLLLLSDGGRYYSRSRGSADRSSNISFPSTSFRSWPTSFRSRIRCELKKLLLQKPAHPRKPWVLVEPGFQNRRKMNEGEILTSDKNAHARGDKNVITIYFKMEDPHIILSLFNEIGWFKNLLKHPQMSYKLPLDSITNWMPIVMPLSSNALNVDWLACLSLSRMNQNIFILAFSHWIWSF